MTMMMMMYRFLGVCCIGCFVQVCLGESGALRGPPKVDTSPLFSSSYIPAAMQIIAHDTELMKYVIKPPPGTTTTTTTTMRPTPSHRPGVFAPAKPLGPTTYFAKSNIQAEFVQHQQEPSGPYYFNRYYTYLPPDNQFARTLDQGANFYDEAEKYLGKGFGDVLRLANRIDPDFDSRDEESRVLEFSRNFEDSDSKYRFELLRQKRVPPTKAYVTMLSLYDMLNKEAKRLMLNKYAGYTQEVLNNLVEFSSSTSSHQLKLILSKVVEKGDTRKSDVVTKIKNLIVDLEQEGSYINDALKDIPPLVFAH